MASTRRLQPLDQLDIYQDPVIRSTSSSHYEPHDVEAALLKALGNNASPKRHLSLLPNAVNSPQKSDKHSSSPAGPLGGRSLNSLSLPPPSQPKFSTDSPSKNSSHYSSQPQMQVPTMHQLGNTYFAAFPPQNMDKENVYHQQNYCHPAQYPNQSYGYKAPLKRVPSSDATPLRDMSNEQLGSIKKIKIVKSEDSQGALILPDPEDMPEVEDDGSKPAHSYATLIAMAILRAPNRRLTLAQIYKWISDHYSFYHAQQTGWQNSIRHNLSLNKAFVKQERPKDDPGKGNYWVIVPGEEKAFLQKEKPARRLTQGSDPTFVQTTQHDFGSMRPSSTPAIGQFTLAPPSSSAKRFDTKLVDSSRFPDDNPSSDATIPASDPALQDEEQQDSLNMPPPASRNIRSSPPPHEDIGSSPPPMASEPISQGTPTGLPKYSSVKAGRSTKYNTGMNDSGYYSSIESSVPRNGGYTNLMPTSEADIDRPRNMKRGRAEEEIARIRGSSYDSPSKDHGHRRKPSVHFDVSSPKRPGTATGINPSTPGRVVFKRPLVPPSTISPNTNLKNHRARMQKLMGESPSKTQMTPLRENYANWSPGYTAFGESFVSPVKNQFTPWRDSLFNTAFNAYDYQNGDDMNARCSPAKKRPGMQRAVTSTGILADITGHALNRVNTTSASASSIDSPFNLAYSPYKMTPNAVVQRSPTKLASPMKRPSIAVAPSVSFEQSANAPEWLDLSLENLFGGADATHLSPFRRNSIIDAGGPDNHFRLASDGSEEGVDILQEFGKIGAQIGAQRYGQASQGSPVRKPSMRPPMNRSVTSRF